MKQISSSRKTLIIENKGKSLIDMKLVSTGIESRKRFYSEINQQPEEYQPKRGMMNNLYQMIRHPIEYFKPKETKMSEMKIEMKEMKTGEIELGLYQQFCKKYYPIGKLMLTNESNIEKEMIHIHDEITKWFYGNLNRNELEQIQTREGSLTRLPTFSSLSGIEKRESIQKTEKKDEEKLN